MKARKCFMCHLLAKAYEMASRRAEKCTLCAFVAFLLSMPIGSCAADTETTGCVGEVVQQPVPEIIVHLPNTPPCAFFKKLTGRDPPTPRSFIIALVNRITTAAQANIRFQ